MRPILAKLKDDPDLSVRRRVANHRGDIAKDPPTLGHELRERWLEGANAERKLARAPRPSSARQEGRTRGAATPSTRQGLAGLGAGQPDS